MFNKLLTNQLDEIPDDSFGAHVPSLALLMARSAKSDQIEHVSPHEDQSDVLGRDNLT